MNIQIYFSDFFNLDPGVLEDYGTLDISLVNDLPLFIDPFLLFNSEDEELQLLHENIIKYITFLRDKAEAGAIKKGLLRDWYCFPEVKQLWFGYSLVGNEGLGLGMDFARKLHHNLHTVFQSFGEEQVTKGTHLEKLCLIEGGVGRDNISDFTANLIADYLAGFTATFASEHMDASRVERHVVAKSYFNYETESWVAASYDLPTFDGDYVLLAPRRILTKDETWINRPDLVSQLSDVVEASNNDVLRAKINNYLLKRLPPFEDHSAKDEREALSDAIREFPEIIEYFIRMKEDRGDLAVSLSDARVEYAKRQFIDNVRWFVGLLANETDFYSTHGGTRAEAAMRVEFLKDVIENKGGWKLFYVDGEPVTKEAHLQILFRFTWLGTPSDLSREVDDGRGPADFKASRGAFDKTIVEFKLARNTKLRQNLEHQVEVYKKAADADHGLKVILFFDDTELTRVRGILDELGLADSPDVILIDGRPKPSASKVA